ncbi:HAD family hydrolase [Roseateles cellulosilyticus]|uniref:HAD-IB family hydrolase n=1 Tax=Pelomonas cellulosilytica TaxID=2906762 RepID=A0ABS8XTF1_9BURK|nr:HAD family hydrolase [Pelomonas sp. P8]MCE4555158.1 HAD-IB family hydrolase [Pelomonas sp. P8]
MNLTLFDLDGTLIPVDSDHSFGQFMVEVGWADAAVWGAKNDEFFAHYNAGTLDLAAYVAFATSAWRGRPLDEALAMRERFMAEVMAPALRPEAVALVERHRAEGDLIALVTATNEFVTAPIAEAFGIEHLIAVQLERDAAGAYTGAVRGVPSFREGKIQRVQAWLEGLGAQWRDFGRVTFYSDSTNDLPLLERVSHPVATNPSASLAAIAAERGWPQLQLFA